MASSVGTMGTILLSFPSQCIINFEVNDIIVSRAQSQLPRFQKVLLFLGITNGPQEQHPLLDFSDQQMIMNKYLNIKANIKLTLMFYINKLKLLCYKVTL